MRTVAFSCLLAAGIGLASLARPVLGAPMAHPTPAALQYEQIVRMVLAPATPAPPGSFEPDRAAIMAGSANQAPQHHGLFGGVQNAYQNAMNAERMIQSGTLERYTYYHNWVRTDDVVQQTATIVKCDQHQYISLDLAHHTYRITSTLPSPEPAPQPGMPRQPSGGSSQPGTADLTLTATHANLGPRTIENESTQGDSSTLSIVMANATGSCRNGSFSTQIVEYVSGVGIPRAYCPLPRVSQMPAATQGYASGGCRPRIHGSATGMAAMGSGQGDRLAMYRTMSVGSAASGGQTFTTLTESGNVRWLGDAEAQALFSIPPGFTQQP